MRVACSLLLVGCLCLGVSGCSLFGKKSADATARNTAPAGGGSGATASPGNDPLTGGQPAQEFSGLLAGRVVDRYNATPSNTYLRWVCLDEQRKDEAPIDVAVNAEGYFTIQGLKAGKHYKLMARSKQNGKVMAGTAYATAPDVRLVIELKEEFATPETPDIPPPPAPYDPNSSPEGGKKLTDTSASNEAPEWGPGAGGPKAAQGRGFNIGQPTPLGGPDSGAPQWQGNPQAPKTYPPNLAAGEPARPSDPLASIPPPPPPGDGQWGAGPPGGDSPARSGAPSGPVPSCVLVGNQLINLALPQVDGAVWEWKANRRGRLVLLDFWSTTCLPCRDTVPHLKILQSRFGPYGLEVLGVTAETAGSPEEQKVKIARTCQGLQTNYRILMASGRNNPVLEQFRVRVFPTLVLLDEGGHVVWGPHEGVLSRHDLDALEQQIRTRLGVRP